MTLNNNRNQIGLVYNVFRACESLEPDLLEGGILFAISLTNETGRAAAGCGGSVALLAAITNKDICEPRTFPGMPLNCVYATQYRP